MSKQPGLIIGGTFWRGRHRPVEIKDQETADRLGFGSLFRAHAALVAPCFMFEIRDIAGEVRRDFDRNPDGSLSLTERGLREWRKQ